MNTLVVENLSSAQDSSIQCPPPTGIKWILYFMRRVDLSILKEAVRLIIQIGEEYQSVDLAPVQ